MNTPESVNTSFFVPQYDQCTPFALIQSEASFNPEPRIGAERFSRAHVPKMSDMLGNMYLKVCIDDPVFDMQRVRAITPYISAYVIDEIVLYTNRDVLDRITGDQIISSFQIHDPRALGLVRGFLSPSTGVHESYIRIPFWFSAGKYEASAPKLPIVLLGHDQQVFVDVRLRGNPSNDVTTGIPFILSQNARVSMTLITDQVMLGVEERGKIRMEGSVDETLVVTHGQVTARVDGINETTVVVPVRGLCRNLYIGLREEIRVSDIIVSETDRALVDAETSLRVLRSAQENTVGFKTAKVQATSELEVGKELVVKSLDDARLLYNQTFPHAQVPHGQLGIASSLEIPNTTTRSGHRAHRLRGLWIPEEPHVELGCSRTVSGVSIEEGFTVLVEVTNISAPMLPGAYPPPVVLRNPHTGVDFTVSYDSDHRISGRLAFHDIYSDSDLQTKREINVHTASVSLVRSRGTVAVFTISPHFRVKCYSDGHMQADSLVGFDQPETIAGLLDALNVPTASRDSLPFLASVDNRVVRVLLFPGVIGDVRARHLSLPASKPYMETIVDARFYGSEDTNLIHKPPTENGGVGGILAPETITRFYAADAEVNRARFTYHETSGNGTYGFASGPLVAHGAHSAFFMLCKIVVADGTTLRILDSGYDYVEYTREGVLVYVFRQDGWDLRRVVIGEVSRDAWFVLGTCPSSGSVSVNGSIYSAWGGGEDGDSSNNVPLNLPMRFSEGVRYSSIHAYIDHRLSASEMRLASNTITYESDAPHPILAYGMRAWRSKGSKKVASEVGGFTAAISYGHMAAAAGEIEIDSIDTTLGDPDSEYGWITHAYPFDPVPGDHERGSCVFPRIRFTILATDARWTADELLVNGGVVRLAYIRAVDGSHVRIRTRGLGERFSDGTPITLGVQDVVIDGVSDMEVRENTSVAQASSYDDGHAAYRALIDDDGKTWWQTTIEGDSTTGLPFVEFGLGGLYSLMGSRWLLSGTNVTRVLVSGVGTDVVDLFNVRVGVDGVVHLPSVHPTRIWPSPADYDLVSRDMVNDVRIGAVGIHIGSSATAGLSEYTNTDTDDDIVLDIVVTLEFQSSVSVPGGDDGSGLIDVLALTRGGGSAMALRWDSTRGLVVSISSGQDGGGGGDTNMEDFVPLTPACVLAGGWHKVGVGVVVRRRRFRSVVSSGDFFSLSVVLAHASHSGTLRAGMVRSWDGLVPSNVPVFVDDGGTYSLSVAGSDYGASGIDDYAPLVVRNVALHTIGNIGVQDILRMLDCDLDTGGVVHGSTRNTLGYAAYYRGSPKDRLLSYGGLHLGEGQNEKLGLTFRTFDGKGAELISIPRINVRFDLCEGGYSGEKSGIFAFSYDKVFQGHEIGVESNDPSYDPGNPVPLTFTNQVWLSEVASGTVAWVMDGYEPTPVSRVRIYNYPTAEHSSGAFSLEYSRDDWLTSSVAIASRLDRGQAPPNNPRQEYIFRPVSARDWRLRVMGGFDEGVDRVGLMEIQLMSGGECVIALSDISVYDGNGDLTDASSIWVENTAPMFNGVGSGSGSGSSAPATPVLNDVHGLVKVLQAESSSHVVSRVIVRNAGEYLGYSRLDKLEITLPDGRTKVTTNNIGWSLRSGGDGVIDASHLGIEIDLFTYHGVPLVTPIQDTSDQRLVDKTTTTTTTSVAFPPHNGSRLGSWKRPITTFADSENYIDGIKSSGVYYTTIHGGDDPDPRLAYFDLDVIPGRVFMLVSLHKGLGPWGDHAPGLTRGQYANTGLGNVESMESFSLDYDKYRFETFLITSVSGAASNYVEFHRRDWDDARSGKLPNGSSVPVIRSDGLWHGSSGLENIRFDNPFIEYGGNATTIWGQSGSSLRTDFKNSPAVMGLALYIGGDQYMGSKTKPITTNDILSMHWPLKRVGGELYINLVTADSTTTALRSRTGLFQSYVDTDGFVHVSMVDDGSYWPTMDSIRSHDAFSGLSKPTHIRFRSVGGGDNVHTVSISDISRALENIGETPRDMLASISYSPGDSLSETQAMFIEGYFVTGYDRSVDVVSVQDRAFFGGGWLNNKTGMPWSILVGWDRSVILPPSIGYPNTDNGVLFSNRLHDTAVLDRAVITTRGLTRDHVVVLEAYGGSRWITCCVARSEGGSGYGITQGLVVFNMSVPPILFADPETTHCRFTHSTLARTQGTGIIPACGVWLSEGVESVDLSIDPSTGYALVRSKYENESAMIPDGNNNLLNFPMGGSAWSVDMLKVNMAESQYGGVSLRLEPIPEFLAVSDVDVNESSIMLFFTIMVGTETGTSDVVGKASSRVLRTGGTNRDVLGLNLFVCPVSEDNALFGLTYSITDAFGNPNPAGDHLQGATMSEVVHTHLRGVALGLVVVMSHHDYGVKVFADSAGDDQGLDGGEIIAIDAGNGGGSLQTNSLSVTFGPGREQTDNSLPFPMEITRVHMVTGGLPVMSSDAFDSYTGGTGYDSRDVIVGEGIATGVSYPGFSMRYASGIHGGGGVIIMDPDGSGDALGVVMKGAGGNASSPVGQARVDEEATVYVDSGMVSRDLDKPCDVPRITRMGRIDDFTVEITLSTWGVGMGSGFSARIPIAFVDEMPTTRSLLMSVSYDPNTGALILYIESRSSLDRLFINKGAVPISTRYIFDRVYDTSSFFDDNGTCVLPLRLAASGIWSVEPYFELQGREPISIERRSAPYSWGPCMVHPETKGGMGGFTVLIDVEHTIATGGLIFATEGVMLHVSSVDRRTVFVFTFSPRGGVCSGGGACDALKVERVYSLGVPNPLAKSKARVALGFDVSSEVSVYDITNDNGSWFLGKFEWEGVGSRDRETIAERMHQDVCSTSTENGGIFPRGAMIGDGCIVLNETFEGNARIQELTTSVRLWDNNVVFSALRVGSTISPSSFMRVSGVYLREGSGAGARPPLPLVSNETLVSSLVVESLGSNGYVDVGDTYRGTTRPDVVQALEDLDVRRENLAGLEKMETVYCTEYETGVKRIDLASKTYASDLTRWGWLYDAAPVASSVRTTIGSPDEGLIARWDFINGSRIDVISALVIEISGSGSNTSVAYDGTGLTASAGAIARVDDFKGLLNLLLLPFTVSSWLTLSITNGPKTIFSLANGISLYSTIDGDITLRYGPGTGEIVPTGFRIESDGERHFIALVYDRGYLLIFFDTENVFSKSLQPRALVPSTDGRAELILGGPESETESDYSSDGSYIRFDLVRVYTSSVSYARHVEMYRAETRSSTTWVVRSMGSDPVVIDDIHMYSGIAPYDADDNVLRTTPPLLESSDPPLVDGGPITIGIGLGEELVVRFQRPVEVSAIRVKVSGGARLNSLSSPSQILGLSKVDAGYGNGSVLEFGTMRVFDLGIQTFDTQTSSYLLYNGDDYDVVGFLGGLGSAAPEYPLPTATSVDAGYILSSGSQAMDDVLDAQVLSGKRTLSEASIAARFEFYRGFKVAGSSEGIGGGGVDGKSVTHIDVVGGATSGMQAGQAFSVLRDCLLTAIHVPYMTGSRSERRVSVYARDPGLVDVVGGSGSSAWGSAISFRKFWISSVSTCVLDEPLFVRAGWEIAILCSVDGMHGLETAAEEQVQGGNGGVFVRSGGAFVYDVGLHNGLPPQLHIVSFPTPPDSPPRFLGSVSIRYEEISAHAPGAIADDTRVAMIRGTGAFLSGRTFYLKNIHSGAESCRVLLPNVHAGSSLFMSLVWSSSTTTNNGGPVTATVEAAIDGTVVCAIEDEHVVISESSFGIVPVDVRVVNHNSTTNATVSSSSSSSSGGTILVEVGHYYVYSDAFAHETLASILGIQPWDKLLYPEGYPRSVRIDTGRARTVTRASFRGSDRYPVSSLDISTPIDSVGTRGVISSGQNDGGGSSNVTVQVQTNSVLSSTDGVYDITLGGFASGFRCVDLTGLLERVRLGSGSPVSRDYVSGLVHFANGKNDYSSLVYLTGCIDWRKYSAFSLGFSHAVAIDDGDEIVLFEICLAPSSLQVQVFVLGGEKGSSILGIRQSGGGAAASYLQASPGVVADVDNGGFTDAWVDPLDTLSRIVSIYVVRSDASSSPVFAIGMVGMVPSDIGVGTMLRVVGVGTTGVDVDVVVGGIVPGSMAFEVYAKLDEDGGGGILQGLVDDFDHGFTYTYMYRSRVIDSIDLPAVLVYERDPDLDDASVVHRITIGASSCFIRTPLDLLYDIGDDEEVVVEEEIKIGGRACSATFTSFAHTTTFQRIGSWLKSSLGGFTFKSSVGKIPNMSRLSATQLYTHDRDFTPPDLRDIDSIFSDRLKVRRDVFSSSITSIQLMINNVDVFPLAPMNAAGQRVAPEYFTTILPYSRGYATGPVTNLNMVPFGFGSYLSMGRLGLPTNQPTGFINLSLNDATVHVTTDHVLSGELVVFWESYNFSRVHENKLSLVFQ